MSDTTKPSRTTRPDIAVVGVSALFPGSFDGTGFWKDILAGTDRITDVPATHWKIEDYYDPDPSVPDKTYAKRGAFLGDVDFDALGWGIPPSILPETDTSQLLALIVAQKVLEDAATATPEKTDHSRTSVILGVTSGQELLGSMVSRLQRPVWSKALREAGLPSDEVDDICARIAAHYTPWRESTFPGLLGNVVAGRIANRLNLGGTNCVTDAACASTLSSLSMAVNELYLGDSDMVIAGGVDTMNDIFMFMCFSKTPALSPSGDCRPFSDAADGTMLGEGLGMVALKRLEDAERDGNRIYAVIKAVGSSSDGRSKSVYAPLPEGQARSLRRAYELAGYGPETVEFVEAHGTGTVAGDAAEFEGLCTVFNESGREDRQWCALGSIKSQIGHTKAAAGAAGLIKAVLSLHHRVLPPITKIDRPNPALALERSPFHLPARARPWVRDSSHPRRASVSSFGFGGSNFHVALEEYVATSDSPRPARRPAPRLRSFTHELVVLHGESGEEVAAQARRHAALCDKRGYLAWLAHDTQRGHDAGARARLAIVATDETDLRARLEQAAALLAKDGATPFSTPTGIHYGSGAAEGKLAFLFPGQGSQYHDMGSALAMHFDPALAAWDAAANATCDGGTKMHDVVFARTAYDDEERAAQARRLTATEWAQPAIGCMSLSLLALLDRLGLEADCHGGHSFGEVSALCAAGVLSPADLVRVARRRGELMRDAARTPGSMIAVAISVADVKSRLETWGIDVVVANHNSPGQVVLSGTTSAIETVEAKLGAQGVTTHRLGVATAFHSPVVAEAAHAFDAWLGDIDFRAPEAPVYSNTTAEPHPRDPASIRARLGEQLAHPVLFMEMVEAMYGSGVRTFVEVGPGSILTDLTARILEGRPHAAVALDRRGVDGMRGLWQGLAALVAAGHPLDFPALLSEYASPENPHTRAQPKLALAINGSNFGKPYPPKDDTVTSPLPMPSRANGAQAQTSMGTQARTSASRQRHASAGTHAGTNGSAPAPSSASAYAREVATPTPVVTKASAAATTVAAAAATRSSAASTVAVPTAPFASAAMPVVARAANGAPVSSPLTASPAPRAALGGDWADAFESAQRQTAEAHSAYVEAMARSHHAFLDTVAQGFDALAAGFAQRNSAPAAGESIQSEWTSREPRAIAVGPPTVTDAHDNGIRAATVKSKPPGHAPETDAHAAVPAPAAATVVVATSPAPARIAAALVELESLMLEIVSEKTGYPTEMLTMEMELEGDLGIDSIKRVEILAAMQERAPGLPEVEVRVMAKLRTLGQIVDYMNGEIAKAGGAVAGNSAATAGNGATPDDAATPGTATAATPGTSPHAHSVPAASSPAQLATLMLEIVAEKTGYPTEMLTMDMVLEGDLGIDSIKRVEILAAMQERAPGLPEVEVRVMAKLRTLGQIVDYMNAEIARAAGASSTGTSPVGASSIGAHDVSSMPALDTPSVDASDAPSLNGAPSPSSPLGRFALKAVESSPIGMSQRGILGKGRVVVTDDGTDLAQALAEELTKRGLRADVVTEVPRENLHGVVFLGGLRAVANDDEAIAVNREAFAAAKAAAASFAPGEDGAPVREGFFLMVQDTGGSFGAAGVDPRRAWLAGCAGLARTLAQEWHGVAVKAVDLERGDRPARELAEALADELLGGGPDLDVGLSAAGRRVVLRSVAAEVERGALRLAEGDVVVASGGARGVTATTLVALARQARLRFVLLGRTEAAPEPTECAGIDGDAALKRALLSRAKAGGLHIAPAALGREVSDIVARREIRSTLEALEAAGSEARYLCVDVTDEDAVAAALAEVRTTWGPIHAVVHGAGVIHDRLVVEKTAEQFDRVFDTKVKGLRALLHATAGDPLSALLLFSSVAARCGNLGQGDYAMANEILNKVAVAEARRRGDDCLVRALGWGPWAGGMVSPDLQARFETLGVPLIDLASGATMFVDELTGGGSDVVELVLGGRPRPEALLPTPGGRVLRLDVTVSQRSHPYLSDHSIRATPVVPVALVIEWFGRAAGAFAPERSLAVLRNLQVLRGIPLGDFESGVLHLVVTCRQVTVGDDRALALDLADTSGRAFYRCTAETEDVRSPHRGHASDRVHHPNQLGLEAWGDRRVYDGDVLFHGPRFQMIRRIEGISKRGIAAHLDGVLDLDWHLDDDGEAPSAKRGEAAKWRTDPAAFDGGLQLALLWCKHTHGHASLPTGIAAVRTWSDGVPSGPIHCTVIGRDSRGARSLSDVVFRDGEGRVFAEFEGVETHRVPDAPAADGRA